MKSLFDPRQREAMLQRIGRLSPEISPKWGRMCAGEMLAHVVLGMRMGLGDLPTRARRGPFRHWPLKHLFVYWFPFPRGARAPREVVTRGEPFVWDRDVEILREQIEEFARRDRRGSWPVHPVFGPLSGRAWGALGWRHLDHHLRQFGV